jgi:hypothetical protein
MPSPHWHVPPLQKEPPVHLLPHPPQLLTSVCKNTQAPLQLTLPASPQLAVHTPVRHESAAVQALPQLPQLP